MSPREKDQADRNRIDDSGGLGARQWLLVVCGVLLALFFVLNLQDVKVHLLIATVKMPLVIALAIAAVLGLLVGWAVPHLRRGRGGSKS